MYGPSDRWQDYIDASWAHAQIETGPRAESTCTEVQYARKVGDVTVARGVEQASRDRGGLVLLRWLASNMLEALTPDARRLLLSTVARDPPIAAALYCWHPNLTDEEDELLKLAFFPTMAAMRHKVESGTCKRAKHG